jgi:anti-anti-sigma regulatory factor
VVAFVERTREPVVLGDAANAGRFSGDAYLAARPPRSLLCVAMAHQGRLAGILYLENHVAREAFTEERVELTSLLASHAAVAVENALLIDELRRRTRELGESNLALRETNAKLERELYDREQAEAARAALNAELVRVQTPLIPISDRIMVMPLIGTIDEERARQILETALRGVAKSRAKVVILDVTGVDAVDSGVQSTLVSTASALRLLGAQAMITGISPDMARSLVSLGLDLGALVTQSTLAAGIAHAMGRSSR